MAPEHRSTPQQKPDPAPESTDNTPSNMAFVPGFGWLEYQGSGEVIYADDMYENGNKIRNMG